MTVRKRGVGIVYLCLNLLLLLSTAVYGGQYANPQLLVTPADVEKNAGKWVVIDCRDTATTTDKKSGATLKGYSDGHIPGAISLGGDCAKVLREKETSTVFKDEKIYEKLLGDAGLTADKTVVVYGDLPRLTHATVGFWVLEYLGQKDVRFLNGGIEAWEKAGKTLETKEHKLPPAKYDAKIHASRLATTEEVLKIARGEMKDPQLVDSRTSAEYEGKDVRAKRGGRIPRCSVNVSHVDIFDKGTGTLKSMDELEKIYGGLDKKKRVIPYCQTGTRSTLAYVAFRAMGFKDPANYDDSWIIWGNDEARCPVEQ